MKRLELRRYKLTLVGDSTWKSLQPDSCRRQERTGRIIGSGQNTWEYARNEPGLALTWLGYNYTSVTVPLHWALTLESTSITELITSMHTRRPYPDFLLMLSALLALPLTWSIQLLAQEPEFGPKFRNLESMATGQWWTVKPNKQRPMDLNVPRDQVVAFAIYTHDHGTLKLSAQLFPLMPDEERTVRLEFQGADGTWKEAAKAAVIDLGWSAHFRINDWDNSKDVRLSRPPWARRRSLTG